MAARWVAAVLTGTLLVGCTDEPSSDDPAAAARPAAAAGPIERFLTQVLPRGSSGSLVAVDDGGTVLCHGWGESDREAGTDAGCDTVYDVMSMTKQFTAAAVLRLQMDGRLAVADPIGDHLDGVPADKQGITLHHLLTHSSGLVGTLGDDYEPVSRDGIVAAAMDSELRSRPGQRYRYSNVGYSLLAVVIETASGSTYEEYLAEHLFAPAGMTSTGYVLPDWTPADIAVEYDARGEPQGRPMDHPWAADGPHWNLRGNGGLLSTARDMARWHLALETDLVLDEPAQEQLFAPHVREQPGGDSHYGYGWVVLATSHGPAAWHNGGNGWSYGEVVRLPDEGTMVFWVTNHARNEAPGWNLETRGQRVTRGVVARLAGVLTP